MSKNVMSQEELAKWTEALEIAKGISGEMKEICEGTERLHLRLKARKQKRIKSF